MSPGPRNPFAPVPEGVRFPSENLADHSRARDAESDLAQLFAKFEQNSGGTLSPQFSADLALDIVLNEIVEQACLATCASGAAVVLRRDGGFVCRASIGAHAPALGAHMDAHSGLSGLCLQSGQAQSCDDAQIDLRADREASVRLGVRSVMVLPLRRPAGLLGILEVMSDRPAAFGERDQRTLEVFAARVMRNVERAADPFLLRADATRSNNPIQIRLLEEMPSTQPAFEAPLSGPIFGAPPEPKPSRSGDFVTWLMGLFLLAGAVLLGMLTGRKFGWNLVNFRAQAAKVSAPVASRQQNVKATSGQVRDTPDPSSAEATSPAVGQPNTALKSAANGSAPSSATADGSLQVFENGKEVFRLPPSRARNESQGRQVGKPIVKVSPAAAEASVIYRVDPEYPESASAQNLQGQVVLQIRVRSDGTVEEVQLVSGNPLFAQTAIDAVRQWKFKPQAEKGDPAEMQTQVTLNFRLPH
jgi:TonB family protein